MTDRLAGRVAFITGAARGQGRAHAVKMADEGADIIAVDIAGPLPPCVPYDHATPEDLAETVRLVEKTGQRILASVVDTRDLDALKTAVDAGVTELGRLDVIVANAGISAPQAWDKISADDFDDVMAINVTGTWNTVMSGAQHIIDGGRGGSIILISSAAGISMQPFMIHYTASKHAVTGMARAFAAELGKHTIRVNSVHPGPVATDMGTGDMMAPCNEPVRPIRSWPTCGTPMMPPGWQHVRGHRRDGRAGWPLTSPNASPLRRSPSTSAPRSTESKRDGLLRHHGRPVGGLRSPAVHRVRAHLVHRRRRPALRHARRRRAEPGGGVTRRARRPGGAQPGGARGSDTGVRRRRPARLDDLLVSVRTRRRAGHPGVAAPGRSSRTPPIGAARRQRRTGDRQRGRWHSPHRTPGGTARGSLRRISPRRCSNRGFTFSPAVRPARRNG